MMNIWARIYNFVINNNLIMFLLALDTCRAFVATWGIIPRHCPVLGRIIYGKRDEDLLKSVLLQLGYSRKKTINIVDRISEKKNSSTCNIGDPVGHLLNILSQYTIKFDTNISYGTIAKDKKTSYSQYYISTMDAVHDADSLNDLTIIMAKLIDKFHSKGLDFIIVPKGGNPILAQSVASRLGIDLVMAKDQNDSARPPQDGGKRDKKLLFEIRYEGVKKVLENEKQKKVGILLDCNTSGGTQLRSIVAEFNDNIRDGGYGIEPIKDVFVLFKLVKKQGENKKKFEESFTDIGCSLYRYFDLDEQDKATLVHIPENEYYYNFEELENLKNNLKKKKCLYYKE